MLRHLFIYSEEIAEKVDQYFESRQAHLFISFLVVLNALIFGAEAIPSIHEPFEELLEIGDALILTVFVIELGARMMVTRAKFFRNYWNVFDLIVTMISLIPSSYGLKTLRVLRVLHSMRLLEIIPKTKHIMDGLAHALPGLLAVTLLSFVFYYVFSIIGVGLLAEHLPDKFSNLGSAMYYLFVVMVTGEWLTYSESVPEVPHVWIFFVLFMVLMGYFIVNLLLGAIISAMAQAEREAEGPGLLERKVDHLLTLVKAQQAELAKLQHFARKTPPLKTSSRPGGEAGSSSSSSDPSGLSGLSKPLPQEDE